MLSTSFLAALALPSWNLLTKPRIGVYSIALLAKLPRVWAALLSLKVFIPRFRASLPPMSATSPNVERAQKQISIKLNNSTIEYFKEMASRKGVPYQVLINIFLNDCVEKSSISSWAGHRA